MRLHTLLLTLLVVTASYASAADIKRINPDELSKPTGYTHIVTAKGERTIYISGQVAINASGTVVGRGDLSAQAEQVFQNLQAALTAAGATFDDVVKITYFVVNLKPDTMTPIREVRDKYIKSGYPASTAVGVQSLVSKEFLLEVEAIAVK